ncbi:MAG: PEP-CTERM sorting domain-containing protein [Luteolibacter sp.]
MKARALAAIVLTTLSASAATSVTNSNSVSTTVNASTSTTNPNTVTDGSVIATANAGQLTLTNPGLNLNSLEYSGTGATFASLTATKSASQGTGTTFSGNATYTVAFTIGVGETAQVVFDLGYIVNNSENASITWGMTGPQSTSAIAGSITTGTGASQSITQQTLTLNTAGTYTFTLQGNISNNGALPNGNNQALSSVTFNNIDLKVTSLLTVPEPSSAALLGLATLGLLRRRSR